MKIGTYLKYNRIKQNKTQADLSSGICTPSYLSRLENNLVIPDDEIYTLLFKRLNLSFQEIIKDNDNLDNRLEEWYKKMFFTKESDENINELKELCEISRPHTSIKFKIIYCRHLILNHQIESAERKIEHLTKINITNKNNRNYFLYVNVLMLFHYMKNNHSKAIKIGINALSTDGFTSHATDYEVGAFYYNLALNNKDLYIYSECNKYAKKALSYFLDKYYLEQAIDCHILLGISMNHLRQWNESLNAYIKADRLLKYIPDKHQRNYLGMINHNMGYCFQNINEFEKAIYYYGKSLRFKQGMAKLPTLITLLQCYYSLGDIDKSKEFLIKSLQLKEQETSVIIKLQLDIMNLVLLDDLPPLDQINKIKKEYFSVFVNQEVWDAVIFYGKIMTALFERYHHYKSAVKIYKSISRAKYKLLARQLGGDEN